MRAVCEWLERALRDLKAAKILMKEELFNESAFHSQQAVEKALKALLVVRHIKPPKTHDIWV